MKWHKEDRYIGIVFCFCFLRRKDVWLILSNIDKLKATNRNFKYEIECRKEGPSDRIIVKDLNRTFSDVAFFSVQDKQNKV